MSENGMAGTCGVGPERPGAPKVFVFNRSCAGIASGTEQRKQRQLSRLRT